MSDEKTQDECATAGESAADVVTDPILEPPVASRTRVRDVVVAVAVLAVMAAIVGFLTVVPISVDGALMVVTRGSTVADLVRTGRLAGMPGDLMSVQRHLLREHAGGPPTVRVDGEIVASSAVLAFGEHVWSAHGPDIVEPIATRTVETTPSVRYVGHGPVASVEESGAPGVSEVGVGTVSGEVAWRHVLHRGSAMVVRREPAWPGRKEVALTFDDGPWPHSTDAILAQLKAAGVKATFFEIGRQVKQRPEMTRRVLAAGMEVGNHSYSHKYIGKGYSHKAIVSEIAGGMKAIKAATGKDPVWYRPAGGSVNSFVFAEARKLGLRVILWTIDPKDWKRPGTKVIERRVLNNVRPGSVILMHDGGGDRSQSVAALKVILKALKARHYKMVTLSRLYRLPGATP